MVGACDRPRPPTLRLEFFLIVSSQGSLVARCRLLSRLASNFGARSLRERPAVTLLTHYSVGGRRLRLRHASKRASPRPSASLAKKRKGPVGPLISLNNWNGLK